MAEVQGRCSACFGRIEWSSAAAGPAVCQRCGTRVDPPGDSGDERALAGEAQESQGIFEPQESDPLAEAVSAATVGTRPRADVTVRAPQPVRAGSPLVTVAGWVVATCVAIAWALTATFSLNKPAEPARPTAAAVVPDGATRQSQQQQSVAVERPVVRPEPRAAATLEPRHPKRRESPLFVDGPTEPRTDDASRDVKPAATAPTTRPITPTPIVAAADPPPKAPTTAPQTRPGSRVAIVTRPDPVPLPPVVRGVSDQQIGDAIQRGVNWFIGKPFDDDDAKERAEKSGEFPAQFENRAVLAVYALLQCGKAVKDPRLAPRSPYMDGMIGGLKKFIPPKEFTYTRSLRAAALALYNRPVDRDVLTSDVDYLMITHVNGAYGYGRSAAGSPGGAAGERGGASVVRGGRSRRGPPIPGSPGWVDNSNSQYGLLGVWAGADAGVRVDDSYWRAVRAHWERSQLDGGQWSYAIGDSIVGMDRPSPTMNAAGTASLFVVDEYLDRNRPKSEDVGRRPYSAALESAMKWWNTGDNGIRVDGGHHWGYAYYGIERVGLASGYKHLGKHDWYRVLASRLVKKQNADGSWDNDPVQTSYALLFLARGRHPILMNKLMYDGYWANRPRDTANLARYAGRRLEREFNWQVVSLKVDYTEWLDSPVLYISGHRKLKFTDLELAKLRSYVEAGGMIFTHADAGSSDFNESVDELATKLFPTYELGKLSQKHPIYSSLFDLNSRPELRGLNNGARLLLVHAPRDLAGVWQRREGADDDKRETFEIGVNIAVYASGKRDFRNRLDIEPMTPPPGTASDTVALARLRYPGNWDPEPGAWKRYAAWFKQETGMELDVQDVELKELTQNHTPIAVLAGTGPQVFTSEERAAIKRYVEGGGVLVVDAPGGANLFYSAARNAIQDTLASGLFMPIPRTHALLNEGAPGMANLSVPQLRVSTLDRRNSGNTYELLRAGDGCVLLAPIDVTCGLLGVTAVDVRGYTPDYARALMLNTIFWALDGQPAP